jgi:hypothetical protein
VSSQTAGRDTRTSVRTLVRTSLAYSRSPIYVASGSRRLATHTDLRGARAARNTSPPTALGDRYQELLELGRKGRHGFRQLWDTFMHDGSGWLGLCLARPGLALGMA